MPSPPINEAANVAPEEPAKNEEKPTEEKATVTDSSDPFAGLS